MIGGGKKQILPLMAVDGVISKGVSGGVVMLAVGTPVGGNGGSGGSTAKPVSFRSAAVPSAQPGTTEADLRQWLRKFATDLGGAGGRYVHIGHNMVRVDRLVQDRPTRFLSTESRDDDAHNVDGWLSRDPLAAQIGTAFVPFYWSIGAILPVTEPQREWRDIENANGTRAGIAIPVQDHAAGSAYLSIFGGHNPMMLRLIAESAAELAYAAVQFHNAAKVVIPSSARAHSKSALTLREIECLRLAAHGRTVVEIGLALGIAGRTVEFHLKNAAAKLGVPTKLRAVALAVGHGLIDV